MACNIIKDEYGRTVAIACTRGNSEMEEWEQMVKELEERTKGEEKSE